MENLVIRLYKTPAAIPEELFKELIWEVTEWRTGGLMKQLALNLREPCPPAEVEDCPVVVGIVDDFPVGWIMVTTPIWRGNPRPIAGIPFRVAMCVRREWRRKGIAKVLCTALRDSYPDRSFIGYTIIADRILREPIKEVEWSTLPYGV